jgi:hypothetical protein
MFMVVSLGFVLKIDKYFECGVDSGRTVFKTITDDMLVDVYTQPQAVGTKKVVALGPWHDLDTSIPYETTQQFERQRADAMSTSDTLYVFDWPVLFEQGVRTLWGQTQKKMHKFGSSIESLASTAADGSLITSPPFGGAPSSPTLNSIRKAMSFSDARQLTNVQAVPMGDSSEPLFTCQELVLCDADTRAPLPKGWLAHAAQAQNSVILPVTRPAGNFCSLDCDLWAFVTAFV